MKAYVVERAGGPDMLSLRDIEAPTVGPDEVRIRVKAFGLNRAEVYRRAGKMGPIDRPVVPGIEAVGEVLVDASGTFRPGQRVATAMGGMQFSRFGSYAEEVCVLRTNVIDLEGTALSWEELAALPESYLTVWGAIGGLIDDQPGKTVLVRGATSSLGQAGIAYAKARGATVIATTRAAENVRRLQAIGADHAIVDHGAVHDAVRTVAPSGVDVVLEVIGASTLRDSVKTLKPFGTAIAVGLLGGPPVLDQLNLMADLPSATRIAFFGSGLFGTPALPLTHTPLAWIAQRIERGDMPSLRVRTFDFDDVANAHRLMEADRALGKLVVKL